MPKLIVGQTVFLSSHDWQKKEIIIETTVTKVGRKYFQIADSGWTQFSVETMRAIVSSGASSDQCYLTRQAIEDERECTRLKESLRKVFDVWGSSTNLSLDQLRRIDVIVKETLRDKG
jgi:myo-inositol catabolism protein IolC